MIPLFGTPFAQRLAWTLVHFLWQGALLGLLAWAAFTWTRRRSPQVRYLLGCAFLLACLGSAATTFTLLASPSAPVTTPASGPLPAPYAPVPTVGSASAPDVAPAQSLARPWQTYLQPYLPWVAAAWALGVLLLSLRTAGGWLWLRRLRAAARPMAEPGWLEDLVRRTGLLRAVRFLESARVATPMCLGLLRPVVLLPLGFFANLDPLAAEAVLAHELAHIRRLDGLVNGLQCAIEILLFFHPAVWWISRRIRTEREHCCDDAAVQACGDAVFYAETLSLLDEYRGWTPSPALQAKGGDLMERLRRLLLSDPPKVRFTMPGLGFAAVLALVASLPAPAGKPQTRLPAAGFPAPLLESAAEAPQMPVIARRIQALPDRPPQVFEFPSAPGPIAALPPGPIQASRMVVAEYPAQVSGTPKPSPPPEETQTPQKPEAVQPDPNDEAPWPAWQVARRRPASAFGPDLDCGPEPTPEEALAFVKIMAERSLWGPNTQIQDVKVLGKVRWYSALTNRWPRGKDADTIIGWEITFLAKPTQVMAPIGRPRLRSILVDKDRVVHWHTHIQGTWNNVMPR
ncbi:M56 family metallopeptidase [Geothrix sp. SG200]|uniref:M56 family metallopeptidase n=1 Tax=Geothrix sp. SG200 TaxID=2922865 RepID=UPI001FAE45E0|nr:M56 family metallopeptidase [Geothrix sp. SG200]